MKMDKVNALLKAVKTDPKARELLGDMTEPRNGEEFIRLCAEAAPKLGFDLTEADIREAITEMEQARREKTAADIRALPDEDLEKAAGGAAENAFWQGETAPDGHEMGCFAIFYSYRWQKDHDIWCRHEYYCSGGHYSQPLPCVDLNYCSGVIIR